MKIGIPLPHASRSRTPEELTAILAPSPLNAIPPPPPTLRLTYPPKTEQIISRFGESTRATERDDLGDNWSKLDELDDDLAENQVLKMTADEWGMGATFVGRSARRLFAKLKRLV